MIARRIGMAIVMSLIIRRGIGALHRAMEAPGFCQPFHSLFSTEGLLRSASRLRNTGSGSSLMTVYNVVFPLQVLRDAAEDIPLPQYDVGRKSMSKPSSFAENRAATGGNTRARYLFQYRAIRKSSRLVSISG